jgi:hypothetical protein
MSKRIPMSEANNRTRCCICYETTQSNNNFSGWRCSGNHSEKMCNSCLCTLMKMDSRCPICRAYKFLFWGLIISKKNKTEIRKKQFGNKYELARKCFKYIYFIDARIDGKYIRKKVKRIRLENYFTTVDDYLNIHQTQSILRSSLGRSNETPITITHFYLREYPDFIKVVNTKFNAFHKKILSIDEIVDILKKKQVDTQIKYPQVKNKWKILKAHNSRKFNNRRTMF